MSDTPGHSITALLLRLLLALGFLLGPVTVEAQGSFEDYFREVRRIVLPEEPFPVSIVEMLAVSPEGERLAVPDRLAGEIHIYTRDGRHLQRLGRSGQGPGEYQTLTEVGWAPDGRLFALDFVGGRLTRYRSDLSFDTLMTQQEFERAVSVQFLSGKLLILSRAPPSTNRLVVASLDGEPLASFFRAPDNADQVPYWRSFYREVTTTTESGSIIVAATTTYPILLLDARGNLIDSLSVVPAGWVPARRPDVGEFAGARQSNVNDYLRSFTLITRLAMLSDSTLLVEHGRFDPAPRNRWLIRSEGLSVYRGTRMVEPWIEAPGRVLGTYQDRLFLLTSDPATPPWTITEYVAIGPEVPDPPVGGQW